MTRNNASVPTIYHNAIIQNHTLIAGATGSGKSVVINGIVDAAIHYTPDEMGLILIDPKRVELREYSYLPHCLRYASEREDIYNALVYAVNLMENRYRQLQQMHTKKWNGKIVLVVIDELADLMTTDKKRVLPYLIRLAQLGRASRIRLVCATQRPTAEVIDKRIAVNIDNRIALRTVTAQDSRNIIYHNGAELLPKFGYGYMLNPDVVGKPVLVKVPMISDEQINDDIQYWKGWK